jgi:hypothetical protein
MAKVWGVSGSSYRAHGPHCGTYPGDQIDAAVLHIDDPAVRDELAPSALTLDDIYMSDSHLKQRVVVLGHPLRSFIRKTAQLHTELTWLLLSSSATVLLSES